MLHALQIRPFILTRERSLSYLLNKFSEKKDTQGFAAMKFVISSQELNYLVNKVLNVVSQKAAVPILSNILIEARNGELILTATDLTVGIRCFTEVKIMEEGATTLPAKRFAQLVRELPSLNAEFSTNANEVTEIIAGSSKFKMYGMNRSEYPALPDMEQAEQVRVKQQDLRNGLYTTAFSVSKEDNRYALTGVNLTIEGTKATLIGTDGKRLAKTSIAIQNDLSVKGNYIIPLKAVEEILKNLNDDDDEITLFLMADKIGIQSSDTTVISKLLSGDYPDVDRVIPKAPETVVSLHRDELISLLRQVALFTSDTTNSVRFTFTDGELQLSANTMEVGEGLVKMPVNYQGSKLEIAFSSAFFIDVLKHIVIKNTDKTETIRLGVTDAFNPGIITHEESGEEAAEQEPQSLYVLMPMRLGEV